MTVPPLVITFICSRFCEDSRAVAPGGAIELQPEIHRVAPESGSTLKALIEIFSHTAGSTCEFWVNPVNFTLQGLPNTDAEGSNWPREGTGRAPPEANASGKTSRRAVRPRSAPCPGGGRRLFTIGIRLRSNLFQW
jgi:hypothetical protein